MTLAGCVDCKHVSHHRVPRSVCFLRRLFIPCTHVSRVPMSAFNSVTPDSIRSRSDTSWKRYPPTRVGLELFRSDTFPTAKWRRLRRAFGGASVSWAVIPHGNPAGEVEQANAASAHHRCRCDLGRLGVRD